MACRPDPKPSFLRDLKAISPNLGMEWNNYCDGWDITETARGKKHIVLRISPDKQDNRVLDLIRLNNANNRAQAEKAAEEAWQREHRERSALQNAKDIAAYRAEEVAKPFATPSVSLSAPKIGDNKLKRIEELSGADGSESS